VAVAAAIVSVMRLVRTLSMALAALALLVAAVPAADAAKPPAKHGKRTPAKKKQAAKKKTVKKQKRQKKAKKKVKKPVDKVFKVTADGSYYRTGTDERDKYTQQIDWIASGTVTVTRDRGRLYLGSGHLTGNIHGYAGDYDLRWEKTAADNTLVGCRMKIEDRIDEQVPWRIDGALQGTEPATAVPYLASGIGKIKRKAEGITTPSNLYDYDCHYYDRGDYPYVVYQRQLAAFPDDAHGDCGSEGNWKGGWQNSCDMQLKDGDETEFWNFTMSITP
jgi:hypothetical protein